MYAAAGPHRAFCSRDSCARTSSDSITSVVPALLGHLSLALASLKLQYGLAKQISKVLASILCCCELQPCWAMPARPISRQPLQWPLSCEGSKHAPHSSAQSLLTSHAAAMLMRHTGEEPPLKVQLGLPDTSALNGSMHEL